MQTRKPLLTRIFRHLFPHDDGPTVFIEVVVVVALLMVVTVGLTSVIAGGTREIFVLVRAAAFPPPDQGQAKGTGKK